MRVPRHRAKQGFRCPLAGCGGFTRVVRDWTGAHQSWCRRERHCLKCGAILSTLETIDVIQPPLIVEADQTLEEA